MTVAREALEEIMKSVLDVELIHECPICGGGWLTLKNGSRVADVHHVECPLKDKEPEDA